MAGRQSSDGGLSAGIASHRGVGAGRRPQARRGGSLGAGRRSGVGNRARRLRPRRPSSGEGAAWSTTVSGGRGRGRRRTARMRVMRCRRAAGGRAVGCCRGRAGRVCGRRRSLPREDDAASGVVYAGSRGIEHGRARAWREPRLRSTRTVAVAVAAVAFAMGRTLFRGHWPSSSVIKLVRTSQIEEDHFGDYLCWLRTSILCRYYQLAVDVAEICLFFLLSGSSSSVLVGRLEFAQWRAC